MRISVFVLFVFFVMGCKDPDGCEPKITRCKGNTVFICNTERDWEESMDCGSVSVGGLVFKCEMNPESKNHECVLKSGEVVPFDTAFDTLFDTSVYGMDAGDGG